MTSFLGIDYELPIQSDGESLWIKLKQGANNVRILGEAVTGYQWWIGNEVTRVKSPVDVPSGQEHKHFWTIPVSVDGGPVKLLTITQATIQRAIYELNANKNWGDAINYDLTITRTGADLDTTYSVVPNPKSPVKKSVKAEYKEWALDNSLGEIVFGVGISQPPTPSKANDDDDSLPF